jgi:hypothetical protein
MQEPSESSDTEIISKVNRAINTPMGMHSTSSTQRVCHAVLEAEHTAHLLQLMFAAASAYCQHSTFEATLLSYLPPTMH